MRINDFVILPNRHNAVGKIKQFLDDDMVLLIVDGEEIIVNSSELGRTVAYY